MASCYEVVWDGRRPDLGGCYLTADYDRPRAGDRRRSAAAGLAAQIVACLITHGPSTSRWIAERCGVDAVEAQRVLHALHRTGGVAIVGWRDQPTGTLPWSQTRQALWEARTS